MRLWLSKSLFHIFYLAIFFVLPLAFPPCIGQEEETRYQQAFAALMAMSYIVVIVESRSSLELQYLKNLLVSFLERQRLERPKIFVGVESYYYANISSSNVTYTEKEITLWKTSYGHWVDVSLGDPVLGRTTATGKVKIDPERLVRRLTNTRTVYTSWKCNSSRSMTDIAVYKHEPLYNGHLRERREWPL